LPSYCGTDSVSIVANTDKNLFQLVIQQENKHRMSA